LRVANQGRVSADVNEGGSGNGGNVIINATERLLVEGGAVISAGTFAEGNAGELIVRAPEIRVIGASADGQFPSGIFASSEPGASGSAGNLTVETQRLRVANGAQISASSSSAGAGNMRIIASEIEIIGQDFNNQFASGLFVSAEEEATGKGGNLTIETEKLRVVDAGLISVATFGAADAGDLRIIASDIEIIGESPDSTSASSVSASAERGSSGNGGNLIIQTERLRIVDSALVTVSTFGSGKGGDLTVIASDVELVGASANGEFASLMTASVERGATGNGGNLTVETERLRLADGSQIASSTFAAGNGGNVTIRAKSIELSDITPDGQAAGGFATSAQPSATGRAGNLIVETEELTVRDGARISSATGGQGRGGNINITASGSVQLMGSRIIAASVAAGDAGDIEITAGSILMNNVGIIEAETASTEGGNITLNANNLLQLRGASTISTTAGTEQGGGNGGDININSPLILAFPTENSDITANAFLGNGGNVDISTRGIFGIEFQDSTTDFSDITASSEFGVDGTVRINAQVNPNSLLPELEEEAVDAASLIDNRCRPGNENRSEYINAGRGGTPSNPREPLNNSSGWVDNRYSATSLQAPTTNSNSEELVEARGWIVNAKGQIELVANPELFVLTNSGFVPVRCVRGDR
jgi:large exoprotein involved in heme utilization and adhesion